MTLRALVSGVTASIAVAALAIAPDTLQANPKVEWNFSTFGNSRANTAGYEAAGRFLAERTGGNFTLKIHYGESVSPARENLDSIKVGAIEAAHISVSYHPGKTPAGTVLDLPFLPLPTLDAIQVVFDAYHDEIDVWKADLAQWDTRIWFTNILPQYEFIGTGSPPRTLEDWRGMRVRALGGLGDAMRQLGAIPTTVTAPESYSAMERGLVRAASFPYAYTFAAFRLHEISNWFTEGLALGTINAPSVMSISAYDRLPEEWKALLLEARPHAYAALKDAYAQADAKWIPEYEKRMTKITYTDEERTGFVEAAGQPVWDAWAKDMTAKGYPGQELLDFVLDRARKASGS